MKQQIQKLLLLVVVTLFASGVYAHDALIDGIYYNLNGTSMTASVTYRSSSYYYTDRYTGDVAIPQSITYDGKEYIVTSIGDDAFHACDRLTSVTIPSSVISIGKAAFYGCIGLTCVSISSYVTSIGNNAFGECSGLIAVNVSSDNPVYCSIDGILYDKDKTTIITCPKGKTGSINIPEGVKSIGNNAFYRCSGLTSVNIPEGVVNIGSWAFEGCNGLTFINIPSSVTNIEPAVFRGCSGLTSVNIPSSVTSIGSWAFEGCCELASINIPEGVTSIGDGAFADCSGLASVSIPESVISIGEKAFGGCNGLIAINVLLGNPTYSSIDGILYDKDKTTLIRCPEGKTGSVNIPEGVVSLEYSAFSNCTRLTSINIPLSVKTIENAVFSGCTGLASASIPESVTSISGYMFSGCTGLTTINIPSSVTNIESPAFSGCTGLTSVNIPSSVTSIGSWVFEGCSGLTTISIPLSVTSIGDSAFKGCTLKSLYLFCKLSSYNKCFVGLDSSSIIYAYGSEINTISKFWSGQIADIDIPYSISARQYLQSVEFKVIANEYVQAILQSVKFGDTEVTPNESGMYVITGLSFGTSYDIIATFKNTDGETIAITKTVKTLEPTVGIGTGSLYKQTTMAISISASSDQTCSADKKGFVFNNKEYDCTNDKVVLGGLTPNTTYTIYPFAEYGATRISNQYGLSVKTASLKPAITALNVSPTSISVKGSYTEDDAHVLEAGFSGQNAGNTLSMTGLKPNTSYTVSYYVKTKEGSNESVSKTFTTPALELTTLQPRCVSSTCAIVAAETNISDDETNVGFQWKKYDAPESLKPSEGYAAIYDGQLEGYIRNLQSTSYYNVRAFYKSGDGTYYYGDWVTFDPSDFSYFEPTVHTYEATEIGSNSAKVKGYVLAGTDNIIEQGFEYWVTGVAESKAMSVKAVTDNNNVTTVFGTGQVMTATLTGLQPSNTYRFRTFVKTASSITYGEEQTFTTEASATGIDYAVTEESSPVATGYYDINGRKYNDLQKGLNIIRYSNGSVRKIFIK